MKLDFTKKTPVNDNAAQEAFNTLLGRNAKNITFLPPQKLRFYHEDLFELYPEFSDRYQRLWESIGERGILHPLIVQQTDLFGNEFEILSGNNRFNVGNNQGMDSFPCIIVKTETDEEARLIVIESNWQRSISDMKPSKRAKVVSEWYNAVKHQGKRTDLLNEIEQLNCEDEYDFPNSKNAKISLKSPIDAENSTSDQIGPKLNDNAFGLSPTDIKRNVRVAMLPDCLLEFVDNQRIPFIAAVDVSYLRNDIWNYIYTLMNSNPKLKLTIKVAITMRQLDKIGELKTLSQVQSAFNGLVNNAEKARKVSLSEKLLSQFFNHQEKKQVITGTIEKSLRLRTQTIPDILRQRGVAITNDDKLDEYIIEAVSAYASITDKEDYLC